MRGMYVVRVGLVALALLWGVTAVHAYEAASDSKSRNPEGSEFSTTASVGGAFAWGESECTTLTGDLETTYSSLGGDKWWTLHLATAYEDDGEDVLQRRYSGLFEYDLGGVRWYALAGAGLESNLKLDYDLRSDIFLGAGYKLVRGNQRENLLDLRTGINWANVDYRTVDDTDSAVTWFVGLKAKWALGGGWSLSDFCNLTDVGDAPGYKLQNDAALSYKLNEHFSAVLKHCYKEATGPTDDTAVDNLLTIGLTYE